MIITHQKGRGTKIHILLDDEYAATTDENLWPDLGISDGMEIDGKEWQELLVKINYKRALNKCSDLLSRRDHSVYELKTKLLRSFDEISTQRAIERYIEIGYLDDERFCRSLVSHLFENKKYSLMQVRQECYKRRIDREIVEAVLAEYDIDSVSTIVQLINSKYKSKLLQENGVEKVKAAMARRGFNYYDIKAALDRLEDYGG